MRRSRCPFHTWLAIAAFAALVGGCAPTLTTRDWPDHGPATALADGLAPHPRPSPGGDLESIQAGVNIKVNQDTGGTADQVETSIAIDPLDPMNLVAASKHTDTEAVDPEGRDRYYYSTDGGQTWSDDLLVENTYTHQTDPTVAFCADGSAVYLMLSSNGVGNGGSGVFAYRSTDGGQSWSLPMTIANNPGFFPFSDKPWVACDTTSSPYQNRIYAEWMDLDPFGQSMKLRWSGDSGTTWSSVITFSDDTRPQNQAVLAVGPNGEVNIVWAYRDINDNVFHKFDRSTDGGVTWGTDVLVVQVDPISSDPNFLRASIPFMDVDRSAGPHSENLYVVWSDQRNGDPDILLVRSTDGGATWSSPIRVNDDPVSNGADQFFPYVAVDPHGRVIVAFWDRRRFIGGPEYEIWGAISRDGGQTFDTNFLVSDVESDSTLNAFLGDYSALAAGADTLYPFWVDLRNGVPSDADVYVDRYPNIFRYDEVDGVSWSSESDMEFTTQDARFDQDLDYDVASGFLAELRADGGYDRVSCAASTWPAPPFVDTRVPPLANGYYYLIRVNGPDGVGTYGDGAPAARPNVRDALDETLAPCP